MKLRLSIILICSILFLSCEKNKETARLKEPNKQKYLSKIKELINQEFIKEGNKLNLSSRNESENINQTFSNSDFDYTTTQYGEFEEAEQVDHFYVTSFHEGSAFEGGLLSIAYEDNHLINIVSVVEMVDSETVMNSIYTLDGTKIGDITVKNGIVINTTIVSDDEVLDGGPVVEETRSWWGCTRDCISDAHIACYLDSHCQTMLLISNLGFRRVPGGQGSGSISVACGATCAFDRDLDLLPQY